MRSITAAATLFFSLAAWTLPGHAFEPVTITPLSTTAKTATGQPITLPGKDVHVTVSIYEIAPGARLPEHKHPFARYALVQAGSLEVTEVESGKTMLYTTGDFIVEMIDQWHRARNVGDNAVKLLVIDQVEGDVGNTLLRSGQH